MNTNDSSTQSFHFKAETQQLLNILIHSLYKDREVFLRELISNASDALTRVNFELLTNRDVLDPESELAIWITTNAEERLLTIRDTGIGMDAEELVTNLGTIAHSGARDFLQAANAEKTPISEIIGQFGVGFYSAFMVAEWISVESRSYKKESKAYRWTSTGQETYTLEDSDKSSRGTEVTVKLKEDAAEFLQDYQIRQIIKKHSDYIPFPIYLNNNPEQVNKQTALWRQQPRQVKPEEYTEFYRQLTLDTSDPFTHTHLVVDAPLQVYAVLYLPQSPERGMLALRREDGLKLYSRKVLIQEYCKDLLPEYLRFIQGVVDTEDLPLNVSRETVQSNKVISQMRKMITAKVFEMIKDFANSKPDEYAKFWKSFGGYLKEGVSTDRENQEVISPLLRFRTLKNPAGWTSLDEYTSQMPESQKKIYYLLGADEDSIIHSPHLDLIRKLNQNVLLLVEPIDSFLLLALRKYKNFELANIATEKIEPPHQEASEKTDEEKVQEQNTQNLLIEAVKKVLGDRVSDVRVTEQLVDSPARLIEGENATPQELQRVMQLLGRETTTSPKILEINPHHAIFKQIDLNQVESPEDVAHLVIEQVYENALWLEGLHPNAASMIQRIQKIMEAAVSHKL
ncbi:MAG TPA: molecular chaperone HtpG [Anaerolineaceae bacterium]